MYHLTYVTQQALLLVLILSGPPVLISLVVGFIISVFQAATQVQEQTLTFVPKAILVFMSLAIFGAWMGAQLMRFTFNIFDRFPYLISQ